MYRKSKLHIQLALVLLIIYAFFSYFKSRYSLAFNRAASDCLNSTIFLVDKWDQDLSPGNLAFFVMNKPNKFYGLGDEWIKIVVSTGEDYIKIEQDKIWRNGEVFAYNDMSWSLKYLGFTMEDIQQEYHLKKNEYFMVGETKTTYDSRYWGTVDGQDVKGKAYAIF